MSKKKGSAKGKKSRAQKRASMPPASQPQSSAPQSVEAQPSAPQSAEAQSSAEPRSTGAASAGAVAAAKTPSSPPSKQSLREPRGFEKEPKEKLDQKIEKLHEKIQEKSEAARAGFASDPAIDDTSIPPVVEDEFFAKGEEPPRISHHPGASGSFEPIHADSRGAYRKASPEARARRGELAKYVKAAVAVSAAILVVGFVKITFFGKHDAQPVPATVAVVSAPIPVVTQAAPPPSQAPAPQDLPPAVATEEAKQEPAAAADAGKVEETKTETAKTEEAKTEKTDDKPEVKPARTAMQERVTAQALLEAGNAAGAIGAAQRSVALDPTDAEAWLILGGALQMQNRNGEARAAFSSCVKQAKRGPITECTQMLSQ